MFYHSNTRVRLLYLRSITRKCCYVFYETYGIILESYTLYRIQLARRLSQKQREILACFNGVFTLMFCESISKIFNFSRTAEKKKTTTILSDNADVSGSIADRSNFMSDCKQMQVRLTNGKYINLERKKYQANMLQNRFELCG